jgi:hypothetical protein
MKGCWLIFYDKGFEERNKEKKDFKCKYFFLVMITRCWKTRIFPMQQKFPFFFKEDRKCHKRIIVENYDMQKVFI